MSTNGEGKVVSIVDDDELMRDAPLGLFKAAGLPGAGIRFGGRFLGLRD
jgi:FixJ family two-component response regulator